MTDQPTPAEVHALLERVIDLEAAERARVLVEACAGRPALRARVEQLLRFDDQEHTLLDHEPALVWAALIDDDDEPVVTHVGPWRIRSELGRGGMGAVYLAERADGQFEKQVALKLVKRGMDTDEILQRFRLERRILAGLEHPHIARLYDGGASEDGRPYLVMELVEGEPVTDWCDRSRLGIDERLALFRTICAAVQYAHQKLVVHRDLKPSNILVENGEPKLLDFGIARLLTEDESWSVTRTGVRVLTPAYAAPEQLRGESVSTAADVYALGAVLFELLTGSRPFDDDRRASDPDRIPPRPSLVVARDASRADAVAAARSTTPAKLRRRLEGDLDVIVLKALEPDPTRRYGSAQQLLDDLERHRAGLPVHARAPTLVYRTRKFARRNRAAITAATLVLLALAGGLATTLWQARTAARERDIANEARRSTGEVMAFLLGMFDSADPMGLRQERTDTMRVRQLIDRGAERVRTELAGQPRLQAEMLTMLGRVYSNLALYENAEDMLEEAGRVAEAAGAGPEQRAIPLILLGTTANQQGRFARADSMLAAAMAAYDDTGAPHDSTYMHAVTERGVALMHNGDYERSAEMHAYALALVDSLELNGTPLHGRALNNYGYLLYSTSDFDAAAQIFRETVALERTYLGKEHPRLASTLNNLASSIHYAGRLEEAEPIYHEAVRIARATLGELHPETGVYLQNIAGFYDDLGRFDVAVPYYEASLRAHEAALGRENPNTALLLRNFGVNRYDAGDVDEAVSILREALAVMRAQMGEEHLYTAVTQSALGSALTAAGELEEAHDLLTMARATLESQLPPDHYLLVGILRDLGYYYLSTGLYEAAEPLLQTAYTRYVEDYGPDHFRSRRTAEYLRELYARTGRAELAEGLASGNGQ